MKASSSVLVIAATAALVITIDNPPAFAQSSPPGKEHAHVPIFFIQNQGQAATPVRFLVETPDLRAGFAPGYVSFLIHNEKIQVSFVGTKTDAQLEAAGPLEGRANFLTGNDPSGWRTGIPTFDRVVYRGLYAGIDLSYAGAGRKIKGEFSVAPGADPHQIRLHYTGAKVSIRSNGSLRVTTNDLQLTEDAPVTYQETEAGRISVDSHFMLLDDSTVGFALGTYDSSRRLNIDPVISYSTYLGGSGLGAVTGVAVDGAGDLYVTGWTESLDFPIAGAAQAVNRGGVDAFVTKLSPNGTTLLYATYIGGTADDRGAAIAVDSFQQAWVTGGTSSSNFPQTLAGHFLGGSRDAFVLKLNAMGNNLAFSTKLGGSDWDAATAIALDLSDTAYVTGDTLSANFPTLSAAQSTIGGKADVFALKVNSQGDIVWSTFVGGSGDEHAGGIAVDKFGNAYITGGTRSANFPLVGAIQSSLSGGQDAFVTKIASSGSQFTYSTYLGGSGGGTSPEQANAIAVDSSGAAYVAGATPSVNFPVTPGALQSLFGGDVDGFLTKLNPAGSALVYSTYLGGASFDWINGVSVDSSNNPYVVGLTSSGNFPVANTLQPFDGLYDAFITKLNATGNSALFSSYYGGTGADGINAIALDANGNIFVGGQTSSFDLPVAGAIQSSNPGASTGWVARLGVTAAPAQVPSTISVSPSSGSGSSVTFTAQYSHPAGATSLVTVSLLINNTASLDFGCYVTYTPSTNLFALFNDIASTGSLPVTPNASGSQQNSQCSLRGQGSFASVSGNTLSLTVSISFLPYHLGNRTVYLAAADSASSTGWVARGTFTSTGLPQPSAVSVSPVSGAGFIQTFNFTFADTLDVSNMTGLLMAFSSSSSTFVNSCAIYYDVAATVVGLLWDNGQNWTTRLLSSSAPLQNSQCTIGAVTVTRSGLSESLSANITFKNSFVGAHNIYMYASDYSFGTSTGWVQKGIYTVTPGGGGPPQPSAVSVSPVSGVGSIQTFNFTFADTLDVSNMTGLVMLFSSSSSTFVNSCSISYDVAATTVGLLWDNAHNSNTRLITSSAPLQNSQCTIGAVTVTRSGLSQSLSANITFNNSFVGAHNIYMYASDYSFGTNTGWVQKGTYTVTQVGGGPPQPSAVSVSPVSGAGSIQTFNFTFADTLDVSNMTGLWMAFSSSSSSFVNSCDVSYDVAATTVGLLWDNAQNSNTRLISSSAPLKNSQCTIGAVTVTRSGLSQNVSVDIIFNFSFLGTHNIYMYASDYAFGTNTGWVQKGTYTVTLTN
jgi:hypothetical protein